MKKVVILFSGEGINAHNVVKELHGKDCLVVGAITNKKHANGIGRLKTLSIHTKILEHQDFPSREEFDSELLKLVKEYDADLVVLSGFMRILTDVFASNVNAINLHPSLLPKYKGSRAIEQSFESGDAECGVSVHYVNSELDGGDIILQKSFTRDENESFESFYAKIKKVELRVMPEAIKKVLRSL